MALFESSETRATTASVRFRRPLFDLKRLQPVELFDSWIFAETDATLALAAWRSASREDKADAHAAYAAALEREEHAAAILEQRLHPAR